MTAEITAVVGCQRAGLHTARLPSPADFAPNEASRRSRKAQPDCVFTTRELCQKPGQEATALDDSPTPADASGSLATTCIGTIPALVRTPSPSLTPSRSPCSVPQALAVIGAGTPGVWAQGNRAVGQAAPQPACEDMMLSVQASLTRLAGCRPARRPRSATRPRTVLRLPDWVAAATDMGIVSVPANVAPQGANTL